MAHQTISVNRKKYAVGLFWQPAATNTPARNYAHSLARAVDKKLNLYTDYRAMVGLGSRKLGHRSGMPVAAADVVDAFDEYSSFLAVFNVDRMFYLVAVRNGVILEDKIFESESRARSEYSRLAAIPDWGAFVAPAAWGMPRAIDVNLSEIMRSRSRVTLHSINRFRTVTFSVVLVAVFLILLFELFGGSLRQMMAPRPRVAAIDPELAAEYKRRIEEKNRELDAQYEIEKPAPPEPIVLPYDSLPNPIDRAALCYQAIGFLMQPITGWAQVTASCADTHAAADVRRSFGTLADFYAVATERMPYAFVQEKNEDNIQIRASLPALPTFASVDERDPDTIVRDVTSAFQAIDANVTVDVVVDVLTNGVETQTVNVIEVAATSKLAPVAFMQIFDGFDGVYMSRAQWNATNRTWNYEVIIYAK